MAVKMASDELVDFLLGLRVKVLELVQVADHVQTENVNKVLAPKSNFLRERIKNYFEPKFISTASKSFHIQLGSNQGRFHWILFNLFSVR